MAAEDTEVSSPPRHVVIVSAGASHSVALLSGSVLCSWGRGEDGQLGHGDAEDRLLPTLLTALTSPGVVSITCGADHTTAYSESELQVYSWGWGDFGRLGHGNSSDLFTPQPIKALQGIRIKQIACGDSHCLAVTMDGEVMSWGRNQNGQLGLGTTEDSLIPQKIQAFQQLTAPDLLQVASSFPHQHRAAAPIFLSVLQPPTVSQRLSLFQASATASPISSDSSSVQIQIQNSDSYVESSSDTEHDPK